MTREQFRAALEFLVDEVNSLAEIVVDVNGDLMTEAEREFLLTKIEIDWKD